MTEEQFLLRRTGSEIVLRVAKKTAALVIAGSLAAFIINVLAPASQSWWRLPAGVLFGGVLGLLNFRWLALAVERVYLRKGATPAGANLAGAIIGVLKLSVIFIVLFIIIKWRLLHIFGLLAGLSLCFLAILWEGLTHRGRVRSELDQTTEDGGHTGR